MLIAQRHQRLTELLRQRGAAALDDLAQDLGVSASTVRRDLDALAKRGVLERTHGGAIYLGQAGAAPGLAAGANASPAVPSSDPHPSLAARMNERADRKQAIAQAAAAMVQPDMTVLLDGGSTVVYAARAIIARPIQVVTNSLSIAQLFKEDDRVELVMAGGSLYPRSEVTVGSLATAAISDLYADLLLFSLAGLDESGGYNLNQSMARVEQAMMRQADRSVMLMDSAKFGKKSLVRVCGIDEVDAIVTDPQIDAAWQTTFGDRLRIAT